MTSPAAPPAAPWLVRAFNEVQRGRHLVLYGNIEDQIRFGDAFCSFSVAIVDFLRAAGFLTVIGYDPADGLSYADTASEQFVRGEMEAHRSISPLSAARLTSETTDPALAGIAIEHGRTFKSPRQERLSESAELLRQRLAALVAPEIKTPEEVLALARLLLMQDRSSCAIILHSADLMFSTAMPSHHELRAQLAMLRRLTTDSVQAPSDDGRLRNVVVLITKELGSLPGWLYQSNPHVAAVQVERPGAAERTAFLAENLGRFHQAEGLSEDEANHVVNSLTTLTDGMSILGLDAMATTSRASKMPVTSPKRLAMRHRFGLREDPWERLELRKIRDAESILSRRVIGQSVAVQAVADVLANARSGLDFVADADQASTRPKGVFFFVGPTGVGKTELAKAIAELVFDDENALRRFDMSEFGQEHTSERLTGSPPGYVGHEHGGALTNWMFERPFSVLLFDEIEKANEKIFDKFLQIIDDGRLTDGKGRTAYFSHSIVIFTSNIGADDIIQTTGPYPPDCPPDYEIIRQHFAGAVVDYFTKRLRRPEFLGRLGSGVVVFDVLREPVIRDIARKFLEQLTGAARNRGFELILDTTAIEQAVVKEVLHDGARLGARQVRSPLLERWVRSPLNRWIITNDPPPGARIWVHRNANSPPFAVELFPEDD